MTEPTRTLPLAAAQHECACGCTDEGVPALDVRPIPHAVRHAAVIGALGAIPSGGSIDLVVHHDPVPLLAQVDAREPGTWSVTYLERGPEVWTLGLTRA